MMGFDRTLLILILNNLVRQIRENPERAVQMISDMIEILDPRDVMRIEPKAPKPDG